jgi:hypothetical protein
VSERERDREKMDVEVLMRERLCVKGRKGEREREGSEG